MTIKKLIMKVKEGLKTEGPQERKARLIKARILDESGNFDSQFFSSNPPTNCEDKEVKI